MPVKWERRQIGTTVSCEARMVWSRLHCLKSSPDQPRSRLAANRLTAALSGVAGGVRASNKSAGWDGEDLNS
jgi:hypothetical protein